MPVSCAGDILADTVLDMLVDVLVGMPAGEIICVRPGIGVDALAEVNVNVRPAVITLEVARLAPFPKLVFCC